MKTSAAVPVRLTQEGDPVDEFGLEAGPAPVVSSTPAAGGRWFVLVAVLALLVIGQAPFVVLWALDFGRSVPPLQPSDTVRHRFEFVPSMALRTEANDRATLPVAPEPARVTVARPVPRGALSGWVKIEVPVSLRIYENGAFLGTTDVDRLMLPVGEHVLDLQNDEVRFRTQRTVDIAAGTTTEVQLDVPRASLSINARPWAEAWVDGERVGETPIGNLLRPIGRHEIVLRHPKLGERREWVLVTLGQPARLSVDLREE